jgi:transposase InsO family protein
MKQTPLPTHVRRSASETTGNALNRTGYNRQRLHSGLGYRTPAEARASMQGVTTRAAA